MIQNWAVETPLPYLGVKDFNFLLQNFHLNLRIFILLEQVLTIRQFLFKLLQLRRTTDWVDLRSLLVAPCIDFDVLAKSIKEAWLQEIIQLFGPRRRGALRCFWQQLLSRRLIECLELVEIVFLRAKILLPSHLGDLIVCPFVLEFDLPFELGLARLVIYKLLLLLFLYFEVKLSLWVISIHYTADIWYVNIVIVVLAVI